MGKTLNKAKKRVFNVVKKLADNAEEGKEKSIEMFMEYVADVSKKIDLTTLGEKITEGAFSEEDIEEYARFKVHQRISQSALTESPGEAPAGVGDGQPDGEREERPAGVPGPCVPEGTVRGLESDPGGNKVQSNRVDDPHDPKDDLGG